MKIPRCVRQELEHVYGAFHAKTPLHGLSHNQIWRMRFDTRTVILKGSESPREFRFYREIAPQLHTGGVCTPQLMGTWHTAEQYWIAIEEIPIALHRDRWLGDPAVLQLLWHLHHSKIEPQSPRHNLFQPQWTKAMTTEALTYFSYDERDELDHLLVNYQQMSQTLFTATHWISGDPNPRNWGVRTDGTVVLFDWERFGRGAPAIDLAITVPGLGTRADYEQVAAGYLQLGSVCDQSAIAQSVEEMISAKIWSVVEFLSNAHRGEVADMTMIPHIVAGVPRWIRSFV